MGISFAGRDSVSVGSNSFTSTSSASKFSSIDAQLPYIVNQASGGTVTEVDNYNGTGQRWRVHTFNSNGTFSVTNAQQPLRYLLVGGGSPGNNACGWGGSGGTGGRVLDSQNQMFSPGNYSVVIGGAGSPTTLGAVSSSAGVSGGGGGGGGSNGNGVQASPGAPGPISNITGTNAHYAGGGGGGAGSGCCPHQPTGGQGAGSIGAGGVGGGEAPWCGGNNGGGAPGGAFVAYRTAYVNRVGF